LRIKCQKVLYNCFQIYHSVVLTLSLLLGKEDEFPTIVVARLLGSKNAINNEVIVDDDGIEAAMKAKMDQMRKQGYSGLLASNLLSVEDEDDDFNLDD